jgi:hypothetical protein
MSKRKPLFIDVIESNKERELQAVYSLQHTAHKLEHPRRKYHLTPQIQMNID